MTTSFNIQRHADSYALAGDLTFNTASTVEQMTLTLFAQQSLLKFDLLGVDNFDSAGLALLVLWLQQAQNNQTKLSYINVPEKIMAMVNAADLGDILPIH